MMEPHTVLEAHLHVVPGNIWISKSVVASHYDIVPIQLIPKYHLVCVV